VHFNTFTAIEILVGPPDQLDADAEAEPAIGFLRRLVQFAGLNSAKSEGRVL
jgi:hypothetical protein